MSARSPIRRAWEAHVLPRLVDASLDERTTGAWRDGVCGAVAGEVLEVGFGSGSNLARYGPGVTRVLAVEPADLAWRRATERIAGFGRPVARIGLDGASLDLPDASVDAVVSTWTMCTIPDLAGALAEMRRVLRPGGRVHFVEHSLSPDAPVARTQRRLQPVWGALAGGCHLDRDLPALLGAAGFVLPDLRSEYLEDRPLARPFGWFVTGTAVPA